MRTLLFSPEKGGEKKEKEGDESKGRDQKALSTAWRP